MRRAVGSCHQALHRGSREHELGQTRGPCTPQLSSRWGPVVMVMLYEAPRDCPSVRPLA